MDDFVATKFGWIAFGDKIFCALGSNNVEGISRRAALASVLESMLRFQFPEKSSSDIKEMIRRGFSDARVIAELSRSSFDLPTWSGASQAQPTLINCDEIICSDKEISSSAASVLDTTETVNEASDEFLDEQKDREESNEAGEDIGLLKNALRSVRASTTRVASDFQAVHQIFLDRLDQMPSESASSTSITSKSNDPMYAKRSTNRKSPEEANCSRK